VTTFDVLTRMRKSLWPFCSKSGIYIDDDSVDLYGPIWIMITLIVEIAIVGYVNNMIDSSTYEMQLKQATKGGVVHTSYAYYSLQKVARSSFVIFAYFITIPLMMMLLIKYVLNIEEVQYLWLFGIYGYSYTVFLLTSALNIIPLEWLRWSLLGVSATVSLIVVLTEVRMQLRDKLTNMPKFMLLVAFLMFTYGVLVLALKKYFLA